MFVNVDNVGAERMSNGRLFQATGPATQTAQLPRCSLVLGGTKSEASFKLLLLVFFVFRPENLFFRGIHIH